MNRPASTFGAKPVEIWNSALSAAISPHGAQLMSLKARGGKELLWQGDPAYWPDRAPILFPVIGPTVNGEIHHNGMSYPMPPHGFAKGRDFVVIGQTNQRCVFELRADSQTRGHYPFEFALRVAFDLTDETLEMTIEVTNEDAEALPADVGYHVGFQWPLTSEHPREEYAVVFANEENAPIRRGTGDPIFLLPDRLPTPVEGKRLRLRDELFNDLAIVFDQIISRSLTYGPDDPHDGTSLRIEFPDSPYFAIWTKPGATFVAIEPWQGLPSPIDFEGPLIDKPGIAVIDPGEKRSWRMIIRLQRFDN